MLLLRLKRKNPINEHELIQVERKIENQLNILKNLILFEVEQENETFVDIVMITVMCVCC